jgi:two-component system response regulator YesN
MILSSHLLFKKSNLVLTSNGAYSFPYFFQNILSFDQLSPQEWSTRYLDSYHHKTVIPAQPITYNGKKTSLVTYIETLGYRNNLLGAVAVVIDNREIQKLLEGLDISEGGWAYIADEQGQIISYVSTMPGEPLPSVIAVDKQNGFFIHDDTQTMITYTTSESNNWRYVVAQPTHIVFEKVNYIKKITFTIVLISFLVGLAIASLMALNSSRPVQSLVLLLTQLGEGEQKASGVYGIIHGAITKLMSGMEELRAKFEIQAPLLHAAFMERLVKGEFHSLKDATTVMEHVGLNIEGHQFAVALIKIRSIEGEMTQDILSRLEINRFVIKEALRSLIGPSAHFHDVEEDKIALLFTFGMLDEEQSKASIRMAIDKVSETMKKDFQLDAIFAIGGLYWSLLEISRSYEEAKQAMHHRGGKSGGEIVWFCDLPTVTLGYYYPNDIELRLINFAKVGDKEEVNKLLSEVFKQNFTDRILSVHQTKLLMFEMIGSISKLSDQLITEDKPIHDRIKSMVQDAEQLQELDKLKATIRMTYDSLCDFSIRTKSIHNKDLVGDIQQLIRNSYANLDFSLAFAAEQFKVSEAYMSQLFKERSGINFFDYLEGIRMEEARKLLVESSLPINEIATRVGYSSLNTFSRAFKRFHGFSATEYRSDEGNRWKSPHFKKE